ncbi:hypothetical protein SDC9_186383 [bioreactor metagenome]|uniref:Uncharacterized protein n=1 Tax=bioreactor metagenome TaxID=1076179 RepID=A0A645HIM1_9ZZZZ
MYPIYENQVGSLNIVANATYGLTGSSYWNSHYTYHPTTLSLGFSYLFNLESE